MSEDLNPLVKEIYLELLENRAHLLTDNQVDHFETLFKRISEFNSSKSIGFLPQFKDQHKELATKPEFKTGILNY